jgi:hypothetical protein
MSQWLGRCLFREATLASPLLVTGACLSGVLHRGFGGHCLATTALPSLRATDARAAAIAMARQPPSQRNGLLRRLSTQSHQCSGPRASPRLARRPPMPGLPQAVHPHAPRRRHLLQPLPAGDAPEACSELVKQPARSGAVPGRAGPAGPLRAPRPDDVVPDTLVDTKHAAAVGEGEPLKGVHYVAAGHADVEPVKARADACRCFRSRYDLRRMPS